MINALQIEKINGDVDILLCVLRVDVTDGDLCVHFKTSNEYRNKFYEKDTWKTYQEI